MLPRENILKAVIQHSKPARLGIGIISAGRVGAVLGASLRACEHTIVGVHAVSEASQERAAMLLPRHGICQDLDALAV